MAEYDAINGFLGDIGFSIKKAVSKVKDSATKATSMAKELSPQYQAAQTAMSQFKGSKGSKGSKGRGSVSTSSAAAIPTTKSSYKTGRGARGTISKIVKKKVFGIPIIYPILGVFVGLPMLKKYARKGKR